MAKKKFTDLASKSNSYESFSSFSYFQNPDKILKEKGDDITIYEDLLSDDHVRAVTRTRKANAINQEWKLTEFDGNKTIIDYVISELNRLDVYKIIYSVMDAVLFGYKVFEINYNNTQIDTLKPKPCRWFAFDNENNLLFKSKENPSGELMPEGKFLIANQEADENNPYGFPDLSCVYWYVIFKKGNIKFWLKFIEKYGMPWAIAKTPPGTAEAIKDDLLEKIDTLLEDGCAVIDDDSNINFIEAAGKGNSAKLYADFLNFCNSSISKAILGSTLTTENKEGVGSQALGNVHQKTAEAITNSDKRIICTFFNKLIKIIIDLKFGLQEKYPLFELENPQAVNEQIAERDTKLHAVGVRFTKDYFKKTYGFSDDDIDVDNTPSPVATAFAESETETPSFLNDVIWEIEKSDNYKEAKKQITTYIKEETPQELVENIEKTMIIGRGTGETA